MAPFSKFVKLAKEQPVGCFFSSLLSFVFLSFAIGGLVFVAYAVFSVALLKDAIYSNTGFHVSAKSIFINAYTGNCVINSLTLENPSSYNLSDSHGEMDLDASNIFLKARRIHAKISPLQLIRGKIEISSLSLEIDEINCIKVNSSNYNFTEFLSSLSGISSLKDGYLDSFFLFVKQVRYCDVTDRRDPFVWTKQVDLTFDKTSPANFSALITQLSEVFSQANVPFIARGLDSIKEK